ncbi:MAG: proton-conducting transporter membrane subunit [Planctomycetaceae bacterium]|nr:hypothetical protein [Planctomycetaceae bacterium]
MIWAILLLPALSGGVCAILRRHRLRRGLLVTTAIAQAAMVASCWVWQPAPTAAGWLALDATGLLFLSITTALFLAAAFYAAGYLRSQGDEELTDYQEGFLFTNSPQAAFTACLLIFLAAMSLVAVSRNLGLLWVAVETTTLASAPLIYFHRHHRSLEATWKYLLICSVGIALAMLGNFFLAVAGAGQDAHLTMESMIAHAAALDPTWLKAAFILCLVGYGTKMGLAPMHTWLPDAHSEAPSLVSALLSGALLNCALLAILRMHAITSAAGLGEFSGSLLVLLGLVSMALAAIFIIHQVDFKRMLAYSSVENMGIIALGVGAGGAAAVGGMFHAVNHSLIKAMLFLVAGNILASYRTKSCPQVQGLLQSNPAGGVLWLAGLLAVAGFPPFGSFMSELAILQGLLADHRYFVAAAYLAALGVAFAAMARIILPMVFGAGTSETLAVRREPFWSIAPPAVLCIAALTLGVYMPPWLGALLQRAAGGH